MDESRVDDAALVQRARGGDVDAYGALVQRYQDLALATAYVILKDRPGGRARRRRPYQRISGTASVSAGRLISGVAPQDCHQRSAHAARRSDCVGQTFSRACQRRWTRLSVQRLLKEQR